MTNAAFYSLITSAIGIFYDEAYFWYSIIGWTLLAYVLIWYPPRRQSQIMGIWIGGLVVFYIHDYLIEFSLEHSWVSAAPWWAWVAGVLLGLMLVAGGQSSGDDFASDASDLDFDPEPQIRYYFYVPYHQKERAKLFGARWDSSLQLWYVQTDASYRALVRQGFRPLDTYDEL